MKPELLEKRYRYPVGMLLGKVRAKLPWADGKAVKAETDMQVLDLLGPKTEADLAPQAKVKQPKAPKAKDDGAKKKAGGKEDDASEDGAATIAELMKTKVRRRGS